MNTKARTKMMLKKGSRALLRLEMVAVQGNSHTVSHCLYNKI
jgi:hypothetical protein